MVLLAHEISASDESPFHVAMRYGIRLSALYAANTRQMGQRWDEWRTGTTVQIPFDTHPESGQSFFEHTVPDGQSLHDLVAAAVPGQPQWNQLHVTPHFLWNHYRNRAFRRAQMVAGGTPERLRAVSERLMLPTPAPTPVVVHAPPGQSAAVTAPPPGPPWWSYVAGLQAGLVTTLQRSWSARQQGRALPPGVRTPLLANTDWKMPAERRFRRNADQRHATWWTMVEDYELTDINVLAKVYERIQGAAPNLWPQMDLITNTWFGSSLGFGFVAPGDVAASERAVSAESAFVRDDTWGAAEHQDPNRSFPSRIFSDRDAHTYREIIADGGEGLHFCVGTTVPEHTNLHIDWADPCNGRDSSGRAEYSSDAIPHLLQVKMGIGIPTSPFTALEASPGLRPVLALQSAFQHGSVRLMDDEMRDQVTFVNANLQRWAAQGYAGWNAARTALAALEQAIQVVRGRDGPGLEMAMNNIVVSDLQERGFW